MNKEIITINGLTIVEDEKGNKKQIDNCDNLSEILIQENIIEHLKKNKEELVARIPEQQKDLKNWYKEYKSLKIFAPVISVAASIFMYFFAYMFEFSNIILSNLGNLSLSMFISAISFLVTSGIISIVGLSIKNTIKTEEKELKGNEKQYEYITKELSKQKELLEKLHNEKEKTQTNDSHELEITKINDKDKLNSLEYYMNLYYNLGCNYDEFLKYYNDGILREKMGKRYTYEEKMLIENYFKESNEKEKVKSLSLK